MPIGKCIDDLLTRNDIDPARDRGLRLVPRRVLCGALRLLRASACGGHLAWRDLVDTGTVGRRQGKPWTYRPHQDRVRRAGSMKEALEKGPAILEGHLEHMKSLPDRPRRARRAGVASARKVADYAASKGVNVSASFVPRMKLARTTAGMTTPIIGQELMVDWLSDVFGIDERALRGSAMNPDPEPGNLPASHGVPGLAGATGHPRYEPPQGRNIVQKRHAALAMFLITLVSYVLNAVDRTVRRSWRSRCAAR